MSWVTIIWAIDRIRLPHAGDGASGHLVPANLAALFSCSQLAAISWRRSLRVNCC
jgi:hypothetical protein